jgi:hypothetical protein
MITLEDGTQHVYKNAPDSITPEQVTQRAQKDFGSNVVHLDGGKSTQKVEELPVWERAGKALAQYGINQGNSVNGLMEPLLHFGTAMVAKPISDIAGMAATGYEAATGNQNSADMPQQFQNSVQNALTYQPTSAAGQSASNPINATVAAIGKGINYINPVDAAQPGTNDTAIGMLRNAGHEGFPQALGIVPLTKPATAITKGALGLGNKVIEMGSNLLPAGAGSTRMALREGKTLNTVVGSKQAETLAALDAAKQGETATQAAVPSGSAEFSAFGQNVGNRFAPSDMQAIKDAQEVARLQQLRSIGRDSPAPDAPTPNMDLATSTRQKVANNLYGEAMTADELRLSQLQKQAQNAKGGIGQGVAGDIPLHPAVEKIAGDLTIQDIAKQTAKSNPELGNPLVSLNGLDKMLTIINDDLASMSSKNPTRLDNVNRADLVKAKSKILEAIKGTPENPGLSPKYDAARQIYADMSTPINQMKIGQVLEDALSSTMEGGAERSTVFKNKVKAAEQLIKNTTGQQRYDSLSKLFTPEQMAKVNDVIAQIDRDSKLKELATAGTTKINAITPDLVASKVVNPHVLDRAVTIPIAIINYAKGIYGKKTLQQLAIDMQDPAKTASLMRNATGKELQTLAMIKSWSNGMGKAAAFDVQASQIPPQQTQPPMLGNR